MELISCRVGAQPPLPCLGNSLPPREAASEATEEGATSSDAACGGPGASLLSSREAGAAGFPGASAGDTCF